MSTEQQESVARAALAEITSPRTVGGLISSVTDAQGVITLSFVAEMGSYPGWHWTVSVVELPGEEPTVLEAELLPGDGALLAPEWVPWATRLEEYRAAQAAAGEPDETQDTDADAESDEDGDDDESDDDESDDDDVDDDGDHGDDDADEFDFEAETDDESDDDESDDDDDESDDDTDDEPDADDDELDDHYEPGSAER